MSGSTFPASRSEKPEIDTTEIPPGTFHAVAVEAEAGNPMLAGMLDEVEAARLAQRQPRPGPVAPIQPAERPVPFSRD